MTGRWVDRQGDVWTEGSDGLMHTVETAPFTREHVERKWGPLRPAANLLAQPTADEAEGDLREVVRVGFRYQDGEVLTPREEANSADDEIPEVVLFVEDDWQTLADLRAALATPPAPEPDSQETT